MTNAEVLDLCGVLGVAAKGPSSSLAEAYADMVTRRAERDGLTRDEQPEEPKPVKKAAPKKAAAKKAAPATARCRRRLQSQRRPSRIVAAAEPDVDAAEAVVDAGRRGRAPSSRQRPHPSSRRRSSRRRSPRPRRPSLRRRVEPEVVERVVEPEVEVAPTPVVVERRAGRTGARSTAPRRRTGAGRCAEPAAGARCLVASDLQRSSDRRWPPARAGGDAARGAPASRSVPQRRSPERPLSPTRPCRSRRLPAVRCRRAASRFRRLPVRLARRAAPVAPAVAPVPAPRRLHPSSRAVAPVAAPGSSRWRSRRWRSRSSRRSRRSRWWRQSSEWSAAPAASHRPSASSSRPGRSAAAVHHLHLARRARSRGRRHHRARCVGPGVRSEAEPHRRPTSCASCSTTARWSRPR